MKTRYLISCAAVAILAGSAVAAHAADATAASGGAPGPGDAMATVTDASTDAAASDTTAAVGEIIVTSQRRSENVQAVPMTLTAITANVLAQQHIETLADIVKYTPNVTFGGNGAGQGVIFMRGLSAGVQGQQSSATIATFPNVALYLDDQSMQFPGRNVDVYAVDLERVEVLEGPQGTLFGASSESGTIRIITNKPDPTHFSAGYDLDANHIDQHGNGWTGEGFINIPLASFAAVRLVGWDEHDGGYISNVAGTSSVGCIVNGVRTFPTWSGQPAGSYSTATGTGTVAPCPAVAPVGSGAITTNPWAQNNYNTVDTRGGRVAVQFNIGDNWTVLPQFMGQSVDSNGFFAYDPSIGDLAVSHYGPEDSQDVWQQSALTVEGKFSNFDLVYAGAYMKRDTHEIADYSDYSEFYDRVYGSGAYWTGNNGLPIMPQEFVYGKGYFEKWSHELRLTTPDKYPVKGTVGLFIERQMHDIWQIYTMPGYNWIDPFGNLENPDGFADSLSVPGYKNTIWLTDEQRVDRDKAAFFQGNWDITSQLSLQGGLRYYWYDNSLFGFFGYSSGYSGGTGEAGCFAPSILKGTPCTNLNTAVSATGTVPRVNLTYKITPEQMVYVTYSKGYRPGGVNRVAGAPPYQADYLTNYEFGWKTQWFDRHLRWNGAAFWENWQNFQFSFLVPPSITAIANGGNARIKGIESDLEWSVAGGLLFSTNFTFLDPVLTQNYCGLSGITNCPNQVTYGPFLPSGELVGPEAPEGTNLPVAPKFKGNIIARYTFAPIGDIEPFAQTSFVYQTQTAPLLRVDETSVIGMQPAYGLLDMQLGGTWEKLSGYFYITNLTDKRAQLSRFTQTNPVVDNQVYILPTQPRTFGIHFAQRF
jgi:iron complex outermembrane recepter protein